MKKLLILGAGGHGRAVAEAAELSKQFEVVGFLDDAWPQKQTSGRHSVLGNISSLPNFTEHADFAIAAIGNNQVRKNLCARLLESGYRLATLFHPAAIVSPSAQVGEGTCIMAGGIVGTDARLGKGVIVNSGANVDHDCVLEDFAHLGVNACMSGGTVLGEAAWLQAGSALGYNVVIPAGTLVPPGTGITT